MKSYFRIGRGIGATPDTVRVPPPVTAADASPARATPAITARPVAACRSVIRPGYSARTRPRPAGSTHGLPLRISDRAKVRTSRKARFAANTRTTSAYSHTPPGARDRNRTRNTGYTPAPRIRFRPGHHPDRQFSQKKRSESPSASPNSLRYNPNVPPCTQFTAHARNSTSRCCGCKSAIPFSNPRNQLFKYSIFLLNQAGRRILFAVSGETKIKK